MLSLFYVFCEINRKVSKDLRKERKVQKHCFLFLLGKKKHHKFTNFTPYLGNEFANLRCLKSYEISIFLPLKAQK